MLRTRHRDRRQTTLAGGGPPAMAANKRAVRLVILRARHPRVVHGVVVIRQRDQRHARVQQLQALVEQQLAVAAAVVVKAHDFLGRLRHLVAQLLCRRGVAILREGGGRVRLRQTRREEDKLVSVSRTSGYS